MVIYYAEIGKIENRGILGPQSAYPSMARSVNTGDFFCLNERSGASQIRQKKYHC